VLEEFTKEFSLNVVEKNKDIYKLRNNIIIIIKVSIKNKLGLIEVYFCVCISLKSSMDTCHYYTILQMRKMKHREVKFLF
jgi:hypothetical protein